MINHVRSTWGWESGAIDHLCCVIAVHLMRKSGKTRGGDSSLSPWAAVNQFQIHAFGWRSYLEQFSMIQKELILPCQMLLFVKSKQILYSIIIKQAVTKTLCNTALMEHIRSKWNHISVCKFLRQLFIFLLLGIAEDLFKSCIIVWLLVFLAKLDKFFVYCHVPRAQQKLDEDNVIKTNRNKGPNYEKKKTSCN